MSFSTLIVRPSGIAPASGGVLESVTQTLAPAPAPKPSLTPQQQAYEDWLESQGGPSALTDRGLRSGNIDEVMDPSGPSYFSVDQGDAFGAGIYDDEGDQFFAARISRDGRVNYGDGTGTRRLGFTGRSLAPSTVFSEAPEPSSEPSDVIVTDTQSDAASPVSTSESSGGLVSATPSSDGESVATPGNTTGGLPANFASNPLEAVPFAIANLAANPVDTFSTKLESTVNEVIDNPFSTVAGTIASSAGKAATGALFGPAAFTGPIGMFGGLAGQTLGKGLGAIADANLSPYSGFTFGNIARAAIPFFGTPIRGSNFGTGMSQEDETEALMSEAEESIAFGTPEPEGLTGFGNVANVEAPTTEETEIQSQIDIARANQEIEDMLGPQTYEEEEAADVIAERGNESELDAPLAGMDPAGGGGGPGGTVVCTALHNHDLFDARGYFAASNYGAHLYRKNPAVMRGYWKIARPFVWLVNHTPSHGKYIIRPVMRAIVKHVSGHGSPVGALIVKTLSPLCALLGRKR